MKTNHLKKKSKLNLNLCEYQDQLKTRLINHLTLYGRTGEIWRAPFRLIYGHVAKATEYTQDNPSHEFPRSR